MGDETFVDPETTQAGMEINKPSRIRRNVRAERRARRGGFSSIEKERRMAGMAASEMGARARSSNPEPVVQRISSSYKQIRLKFDITLLLAVSTLVIFGLLMVYSASWKFSLDAYNSSTAVFSRQLAWTAVGLAAAIVLTFVNYHRWEVFAVVAMLLTVFALVAVLFIHDERNGAVLTILAGSIQPSEVAKIITVIYLSVWLYKKKDQLREVSFGLLPLGVILGILGALILLQPDLSAVVTICVLGAMMFFLAGGDIKQVLVVVILGAFVGWLLVQSGIFPTGKERIGYFLAGIKDPLQASTHVQLSMESFIKGGLFGVGIGKADTKLTILPFPHTDSIFAVVGEETGILGATVLVLLYLLMMWRGLTVAKHAPDQLGSLLAAGLSFWLAIEAFINMAVMVGLLPFAGNALPFISAGGSNRLVSLAAIGIILNISRLSLKEKEEKERVYSAVVNLRRRDWRRSISRPHRPSVPDSQG